MFQVNSKNSERGWESCCIEVWLCGTLSCNIRNPSYLWRTPLAALLSTICRGTPHYWLGSHSSGDMGPAEMGCLANANQIRCYIPWQTTPRQSYVVEWGRNPANLIQVAPRDWKYRRDPGKTFFSRDGRMTCPIDCQSQRHMIERISIQGLKWLGDCPWTVLCRDRDS